MPKKPPDEIAIGKFDMLATSTYAKALLDGESDAETKQRGIVAAIMDAKARRGEKRDHHSEMEAAEKKAKSSINGDGSTHLMETARLVTSPPTVSPNPVLTAPRRFAWPGAFDDNGRRKPRSAT